MDSKKTLKPADYIIRGILLGGSIGVFAALLGIMPSIFWAAGLGMVAGFFAGLTLAAKRSRSSKDSSDSESL